MQLGDAHANIAASNKYRDHCASLYVYLLGAMILYIHNDPRLSIIYNLLFKILFSKFRGLAPLSRNTFITKGLDPPLCQETLS